MLNEEGENILLLSDQRIQYSSADSELTYELAETFSLSSLTSETHSHTSMSTLDIYIEPELPY